MKKRFIVAIVMAGLYGIIYLLNFQFFDIYKPYYMYTVSWTTRGVLPVAASISVLAALFGKRYLTIISFVGYILGIVLGELFGGFEANMPPQYLHHGWEIWGCVFSLSVIAGLLIEKGIRIVSFVSIFIVICILIALFFTLVFKQFTLLTIPIIIILGLSIIGYVIKKLGTTK